MSDMKTLTIGARTWSMPVTSVNGQTGAVVLDAEDVGAATEQDIADAIIQVLPVDSASGAVASFPDGYPAPLESLSVQITPVQSGSGTPAPDNVRPITGWSEAKVWCESTYDPTADPKVTISLSGTRYGGTLDVKTGVMTVTTMLWTAPSDNWSSITRPDGRTIYYHDLPAETINSGIASDRPYSVSDTFGYISSPVYNWYSVIGDCEYIYNVAGISANKRVWIRYESNDFATAINGAEFVFLLQTPLSVQLSASELETILGQNNVWANCGDVAVSYRADIQRYIEKKLS